MPFVIIAFMFCSRIIAFKQCLCRPIDESMSKDALNTTDYTAETVELVIEMEDGVERSIEIVLETCTSTENS